MMSCWSLVDFDKYIYDGGGFDNNNYLTEVVLVFEAYLIHLFAKLIVFATVL